MYISPACRAASALSDRRSCSSRSSRSLCLSSAADSQKSVPSCSYYVTGTMQGVSRMYACRIFSKVSALVYLSCKGTMKGTFRNVCLAHILISYSVTMQRHTMECTFSECMPAAARSASCSARCCASAAAAAARAAATSSARASARVLKLGSSTFPDKKLLNSSSSASSSNWLVRLRRVLSVESSLSLPSPLPPFLAE